jgi:FkbM family methyltransferase
MAAAYHLQNSTVKVERLADFVRHVSAATGIDEIHDVGANAGLFAALCSPAVAAPIHCYEPIPALAPYIAANAPEARIHQLALGDRSGDSVSFFINSQSLQTSSLDRRAIIEETANVTEIEVPIERLDRVASGRTIVKIDVQGAELQVLAGMSGVMPDCQALLVESTYLSLDTVTDIIPLARDAGFTQLYVVNDVSFGADILLTRRPIETCRKAAATSFELV